MVCSRRSHLLHGARVVALYAAVSTSALGCGGLAVVEHDRVDEEASGEDEEGTGGDSAMWAPGCQRDVVAGQIQTATCFPKAASFECPGVYDATLYVSPTRDCAYIVSVDCGPVEMAGRCCYVITEEGAACN